MKNLSFFILVFFLSFLSPAFAAYDNLYLVGNATEAGWDPDGLQRPPAPLFVPGRGRMKAEVPASKNRHNG